MSLDNNFIRYFIDTVRFSESKGTFNEKKINLAFICDWVTTRTLFRTFRENFLEFPFPRSVAKSADVDGEEIEW